MKQSNWLNSTRDEPHMKMTHFPNPCARLEKRSDDTSRVLLHLGPHGMLSVGPPPYHCSLLLVCTSSFPRLLQTVANRLPLHLTVHIAAVPGLCGQSTI